MDYLRIYREFIADRRGLEPTLNGYTERHHVVPRALGGSDDPENLIRLTAEDHIFAHLLLAKAYGGAMWFPLTVMLKPARNAGFQHRGKRAIRIAAVAKLEQSRRQTGVPRPDVSSKLKGRRFSAETRAALSASAIGRKDTSETRERKAAASRGRRWTDSAKAKLSAKRKGDGNPAKRPEVRARIAEKARARNAGAGNPRYDTTVRTFIHADGRVERLTKYEMAAKHGLNRTCLNYVINGERHATKGWSVPAEGHSASD